MAAQTARLRQNTCNAAAAKIQATWRGSTTMDRYLHTISHIVLVQALARRWIASKLSNDVQEEKRMTSATIIQARWRASSAKDVYMTKLLDIIQVQTIVRRVFAQKIMARLKEEKNTREAAAATLISSAWRSHACLKEFRQTVSGTSKFKLISFYGFLQL